MTKIAFIGAGSLEFTQDLVRDILTFPLLRDAHIALMDINAERLEFAKTSIGKIIAAGNYPATVTATLDRVEALRDADVVLTTILSGSTEVWRHDIEIPKKYGVDIQRGRYPRTQRHLPLPAHPTPDDGNCPRYGKGLPQCSAFELHQSHGDALWCPSAADIHHGDRVMPLRPGFRHDACGLDWRTLR